MEHLKSNLDKGLKGEFDLPLRAVFREAWHNVKGLKGAVFAGELYSIILVLVIAIVGFLLAAIVGFLFGELVRRLMMDLSAIISGAAMICAVAFLNRLAMRKLAGREITQKQFFKPYRYFYQAVGIYILNMLCMVPMMALFFILIFLAIAITGHGHSLLSDLSSAQATHQGFEGLGHGFNGVVTLAFLICYVIYSFFSLCLGLVIPMVMERKLKTWICLRFIFRAFSKKFWSILLINFVAALIVLISIIPAGLGLIWTMPWLFSLNAVMYKRAFGLKSE